MTPRSSTLRRAAASFAAAFALLCGQSAAAQAWQANDDDALLLELRAANYRLGENLRGYQTASGICVDLADVIQALDLPVRLDKKSRRATGWIFAEDQRFVLDREANTVQTMNRNGAIAAGAVHDTPEGWCVALPTLSEWLGVRLKPDLGNLAIKLESDRKLPFLEAIARKSRAAQLRSPAFDGFDLSQMPRAETPYKAWRTPSVDVLVRTQLASSGKSAQIQYEALASGELLGASFDARLSSDTSGMPSSLRLRAYRYDPAGISLGPIKLTQIAAGDVETLPGILSGNSAIGRGAIVSNRPIARPSRFATTTLRGAMPAGWDAELYRNGQLRAFQADRGDGRYEFADIELLFGDNDFEVVLYGPQGQIKRERTNSPVGIESIPAGKTWYWAGIVEDGRDLIDFSRNITDPQTGWRWGVGVERGIDKRTSFGLGAQSLMLNGQRHSYVEASLRRALGPMLLEVSGSQQLGAGRAFRAEALGKIGRINFQAETLWIDGDFESELIEPQQRREYGLRIDTELRFGNTRLPIQLGARQSLSRNGTKVTEWLTRASFNLSGLSLSTQLSHQSSTGPSAVGSQDGLRLQLLGNSRIGGVRLRGETRFRLSGPAKGFEAASLTAETRLDARSDLRAGVEYLQGSGKLDLTLGYVRQFKRFALRGEGRIDTKGGLGLGLSLAFSLGPDPLDGGWRMSRERLAQDGQAAVEVFRDENGDGLRQSGEAPIEGAYIKAGYKSSPQSTDKAGRAVIDGLRAFVPVLVGVDAGSLDDPLLLPKGKGVVIVPRPGIAARLMLPVTPTGEVEGTVLGADGEPREGVLLELIDPAGRVAKEIRTEYDGYVLFDQVPYGNYRLRLNEQSARIMGVKADLGVSLRVDKASPTVRLGRIRLDFAATLNVAAGP